MMQYAIIKDGEVENIVVWDGDTDTWPIPDGYQAVQIEDGAEVGIGYTYADGKFSAPLPPQRTPEQIKSDNTATRDALLQQAATALAPLQMAVALGEATDDETAQAKAWVTFSRAVKAIDLTQEAPQWPATP
jgi:hypothetical protein